MAPADSPAEPRGSGGQVGIILDVVLGTKAIALPPALQDYARRANLSQVPEPQAELTSALANLRHTFVVADATLPDCPLIYASEG